MEPDGNSSVALDWGPRLSCPGTTARHPRRRGFQTRTGSAILNAAPWWWWKARSCNSCHGSHHHGYHRHSSQYCWARPILLGLFTLAVYAVPFFVGATAGFYLFQAGTGPLAAIVIGFVAASVTLAAGQYASSVTRSAIARLVIGLLFALPAVRAGYDATLTFVHIGVPSE
jgi:hypothetical protein